MSRTSISFTPPNEKWIDSQIESEEFNSKSDVINDLIRKARSQQDEIDYVRAKLIAAEKSGFISQNRIEMLKEFKDELRDEGNL
jgi:antitoxin ParD1/3/4